MNYHIGVHIDNLSGSRTLKNVWNSDGSLAKIVYADTGLPAAGETVSFGFWDDDLVTADNGFKLGADGLPMTGLVTDFRYEGDSYSMILNADGSRVFGAEDAATLQPVGKKIYALSGGLVMTGDHYTGIYVGDWSRLSAADRKTMDFYSRLGFSANVYVLLNPDGSVAANTVIEGYHTNRLGVPMDYYSPVFKFGGKWMAPFTESTMIYGITIDPIMGYKETEILIKVKANGELIGFYDAETGKALSGAFVLEYGTTPAISLKNGKPQLRSFKFYGLTLTPDKQLGVAWSPMGD